MRYPSRQQKFLVDYNFDVRVLLEGLADSAIDDTCTRDVNENAVAVELQG